jgi:hypothetical protein
MALVRISVRGDMPEQHWPSAHLNVSCGPKVMNVIIIEAAHENAQKTKFLVTVGDG